jgi:hypothetical protein
LTFTIKNSIPLKKLFVLFSAAIASNASFGQVNTVWPPLETYQNVGIGTNNPAGLLDVLATTTGAVPDIYFRGQISGANQNSSSPRLNFVGLAQSAGYSIQAINMSSFGMKDLVFSAHNASDYTTYYEAVRFTYTGRVGIGTAAPAYKLHIANGAAYVDAGANNFFKAGQYATMGNTVATNTPYIAFNAILTTSDLATSTNLITPAYNPGSGLVISGEAGSSGLHFLQKNYNNGTPPYNLNTFSDVMTLNSAGTLSIGTTTPGTSYKLVVEGTIGARKVKVTQAAWADYVFDSTYVLSPLELVENFIDVNKHLPDVPSAAAVEKDGLDLGDNQALLLRKIEELTLYMIEFNKTISRQQEQIKNLQAQLSAKK